jgi:hypothetical protein
MRARVWAILCIWALLGASNAMAQQGPRPPTAPAPRASAAFEVRESWCARYVSWYVANVAPKTPLPSDVRPTQRFEVEFDSCKLDPRQYRRQTQIEARLAARDRAS